MRPSTTRITVKMTISHLFNFIFSRTIEGTLRVWSKYSAHLVKLARKRKSLFEHCPINIEDGKRFVPLEPIDWHEVRMMYTCASENVMGSHPSHNFSLHQAALIDVNICDRFPPTLQSQAALAAAEFYQCVLDLKMMTMVDEKSAKLRMISTTGRSVSEQFGTFESQGNVDKAFRFGEDVTEDYLSLLKVLCTNSYGDQKTSYQLSPSENVLVPLSFEKSKTFDYIHTVAAIIDALNDKVQISSVEEEEWIPTTFHSYPSDSGNIDYSRIPSSYNWQNMIERCFYRLSLIRDDTENCHLVYLAGKMPMF